MTDNPPRTRRRERPSLPDPPFLCADCRHGSMIVQKLQSWQLATEAWEDCTPEWFWQATCRSPRVTPWKFALFTHPVVACDGFRARAVLTTEDVARFEIDVGPLYLELGTAAQQMGMEPLARIAFREGGGVSPARYEEFSRRLEDLSRTPETDEP